MRALRVVQVAVGLVVWAGFGLGFGLVVAAGAPALLGMKSFTVMSGSMEPTLSTGDVVVERKIAPRDIRGGDVVTFHDPENRAKLITHRVRSIRVAGSRAFVETRGDANNNSEHWSVPVNGSVGRVRYHLPLLGYALVWTTGRNARLMLVVVPAVLLGLLELIRIWRPRRPEEEGTADAAA